jgi:hypothetical protein
MTENERKEMQHTVSVMMKQIEELQVKGPEADLKPRGGMVNQVRQELERARAGAFRPPASSRFSRPAFCVSPSLWLNLPS